VVLEELEAFLERQMTRAMTEMAKANTPDEAYAIACGLRAAARFEGEARAAVAVGEAAARELMKEE
jgi:hypothetical protein